MYRILCLCSFLVLSSACTIEHWSTPTTASVEFLSVPTYFMVESNGRFLVDARISVNGAPSIPNGFQANLPMGQNASVRVEAPGYFPVVKTLSGNPTVETVIITMEPL